MAGIQGAPPSRAAGEHLSLMAIYGWRFECTVAELGRLALSLTSASNACVPLQVTRETPCPCNCASICLPSQVVLLREIALHWLRASERPSDRSTASLQETLHACNTALDRAAECIAQAPAAAWGWPPPETCDGSESIPATLGQQESQTRLKAALDRLQLPPLSGEGAPDPFGSISPSPMSC